MRSYRTDNAPAIQFYPSDWLREPALRLCSIEARGLFVDLLCLMFYGTPRGFLNANGKQIDNSGITKIAGEPAEKVERCMKELLDRGVVSLSDDNTIFSRRMYRDWKTKSDAGKAGMDVRWHSKPITKGITKDNSSSSTASSTASSSSPDTVLALAGSPTGVSPEDFIALWNNYADKKGLSRIKSLTGSRRQKLRKRLSEKTFTDNIDKIFEKISASAFLLGEGSSRGWKISLDFLIRNEENYVKILEGNYDGKRGTIDKAKEDIERIRRGEL